MKYVTLEAIFGSQSKNSQEIVHFGHQLYQQEF